MNLNGNLITDASSRNALALRTDVLEKVKALVLLPGHDGMTTEQVANYYEVEKASVQQIVTRHRREIESDGYVVLTGQPLADMMSASGIKRAPKLSFFPRQAILRVGMLLRDSLVAKTVRDYLLKSFISGQGLVSRQIDITSEEAQSPFDSIKQVSADGAEFWSARDLQPMVGYVEWRKFEEAIERAKVSCANQSFAVKDHFGGAAKVIQGGRWGTQTVADYHLSRFGAYLTVMNGDPRKTEIAAAQGYFAAKTREAEVLVPQLESKVNQLLKIVASDFEPVVMDGVGTIQRKQVQSALPQKKTVNFSHLPNGMTADIALKALSVAGYNFKKRELFDLLIQLRYVDRHGYSYTPTALGQKNGVMPYRYEHKSGYGYTVVFDPETLVSVVDSLS